MIVGWHVWTDPKRRDQLAALAAEGLSSRQIANRINETLESWRDPITRNAVISACHRWGIRLMKPSTAQLAAAKVEKGEQPLRPKLPGSRPKTPMKPRSRAPAPPRPKPAPPVDARPGAPLMISLMELTATTCRWPIGEPREPGFGFCGRHTAGATYCGYHARIASTGTPKEIEPPVERRVIPGEAA